MISIRKLTILFVSTVLAFTLFACSGAEQKKAQHMQKGDQYFAEGNYEKASVEYKNVLQIDNKDAKAYYANGKALEKMQDFRGAVGFYLKAVELDPNYSEAMFSLGRIYLLANVLDKASEMADKALAVNPKDASAMALRGAVKARQGDMDAAMKDALEAQRIAPANTDAVALLAGL